MSAERRQIQRIITSPCVLFCYLTHVIKHVLWPDEYSLMPVQHLSFHKHVHCTIVHNRGMHICIRVVGMLQYSWIVEINHNSPGLVSVQWGHKISTRTGSLTQFNNWKLQNSHLENGYYAHYDNPFTAGSQRIPTCPVSRFGAKHAGHHRTKQGSAKETLYNALLTHCAFNHSKQNKAFERKSGVNQIRIIYLCLVIIDNDLSYVLCGCVRGICGANAKWRQVLSVHIDMKLLVIHHSLNLLYCKCSWRKKTTEKEMQRVLFVLALWIFYG